MSVASRSEWPLADAWQWGAAAGQVMAAALAGPTVIEAVQRLRLRALLAHAQAHSPYLARLLRGADPPTVALQDLPVTRKPELMAHFDEWVTERTLKLADLRGFMRDPARIGEPFAGRYTVWQSSGSSGLPGVFVQDPAAMAVYDALEAQRRCWSPRRCLDPWCLGERIVFVGATDGHFASIASMRRLRRLNPLLAPRLHDLSFLQPTAQLVAQLNALMPTVIATYPSAAVLLAEERQPGRLSARPQEIWTGGESLTPAMRRHVEQVFGCSVVDSYGASEFLALASQCRCGHLHVNSDWAILESVDATGRRVPDGQLGATTLLTNLANLVQPLIRYDLGDRICVRTGRCACGSPFPVIEVHGRHDDTLHLRAGGKTVSLMPLALCTVLEEEAGLFDFQIVQRGPSSIEVLIGVGAPPPRARCERALRSLGAYLARVGAGRVRLSCHRARENPRGPGGKVQRVVSLKGG